MQFSFLSVITEAKIYVVLCVHITKQQQLQTEEVKNAKMQMQIKMSDIF